jgi:hypothetical protein
MSVGNGGIYYCRISGFSRYQDNGRSDEQYVMMGSDDGLNAGIIAPPVIME